MQKFLQAKALCGQTLPWCQDEPELLGPVITQFLYDQESYKKRWAQRWFENFQFVFGNSTVKWSRKYDFAVDTDFLRRDTGVNQRASTNISRVVVEALASLIYSNLPEWAVETADESFQKGKRFAAIYEKILDCYMERLNCDKEFANAAICFALFGQVAWKIDWDRNSGKRLEIPQYRKVMAPIFTDYMAPNMFTGGLLEVPTQALGSAGNPMFEERWEPVVDETGRQVVKKMQAGDVRVTTLTPMEYFREVGSHGTHKTRFMEHIRLLDYDEYLYEYGEMPGQTQSANKLKPFAAESAMYEFAMRHFMRMQHTTPPTLGETSGFRRGESFTKNSSFRNKVLVAEHYDRPNPETWEDGRLVVVTNGTCTHITKPTYKTNKQDGWHPFVEAQWMSVTPSSISSGPMDSVTAKNRELNLYDSLIATASRRNLGSTLLYKGGSGFDPQKMSGEPGQSQQVNDVTQLRWLHDDQPIPAVIESLRNQIKEDVYEGSGAGDAMRGDRSKGVSSGYALRQLQEREERRLAPPRKAWERAVAQVGEKITSCLKANCIELADDVMGYLKRAASGEFQNDDIVAFLSNNVDFGVDIKIQAGSMAFKSKATKQADLLELAKLPIMQTRLQDADVLDQFLKYFDADKLRDMSSAHRDRARRENQIFSDYARLGPTASGLKAPVVMFEDDDNIHMAIHVDYLVRNSEEITSNEVYMQSFLLHIEQHRLQMQEKQGQVVPGASIALPQMYAQARQAPPPAPIPTIYMDSQARSQITAQGGGMARQSPKSPAPVGSGGPPQKTADAPAENAAPTNEGAPK